MNPELQSEVDAGRISPQTAAKLESLSPGQFCIHKSWGIGKIAHWDLLMDSVEIDFEGKPGHRMKIDFAVNSLEPLAPSHFLAQRLERCEELTQMAQGDVPELVALVLQSYGGEIALDKFESLVKGSLVAEGDYKKWWDASKRVLKKDRRFQVPARRSEPLKMRSGEASFVESWKEQFAGERQWGARNALLDDLLKHLEELADDLPSLIAVLDEILKSAHKGRSLHAREALEMLLLGYKLAGEIAPEKKEQFVEAIDSLLRHEPANIPEMFNALSLTKLRAVLALIPARDIELLSQAVPSLTGKAISEIARWVQSRELAELWSEDLKPYLYGGQASPEILWWACKDRESSARNLFGEDLFSAVLQCIERDHYEDKKRANKLRDLLLSDRELIGDFVLEVDAQRAKSWARRLQGLPVFDELDRRSLLARFIKVHPEVQDILQASREEKKDELIVSWESLERRKAEHGELLSKKIPENRKEIAIARSYGDLRENFEYKAAKQMQAVLMRRKSEIERDLKRARGTDFRDVDTSKVGIGCVVTLRDEARGESVVYRVLGAWDTDPERKFLSYLSDFAQKMIDKKIGDTIEWNEDDEQRHLVIQAIERHDTVALP